MKRSIAPTTLLIVLAVTFAATVASTSPKTLRTTAEAEDAACSLALAAGKYAFSDSGTVVAIGATTVNYPRAADALLTLDAAGNISGKVTASLNGLVTHSTFSGTYTVNPDCTGTVTFSESGNPIITATADLFWDDNMRESRFIFTSAAAGGTPLETVINGTARKLGGQ